MKQRLQKILSGYGLASRRAAETLIAAGRVSCNGRVCALGDSADPETDVILLDGKPLPARKAPVYILLNKPRGYVTTLSDERGRPTAAELVAGCGRRVFPVGRLDMDSEGLLLFTDDGALANRLTHPSHEVKKQYEVWVSGCTQETLKLLARPVTLDGRPIRPPEVQMLRAEGEQTVLSIVIHEGRNRQIRRMCELAGMRVKRLRRVSEGPLRLNGLCPGTWRYLTEEEVASLQK